MSNIDRYCKHLKKEYMLTSIKVFNPNFLTPLFPEKFLNCDSTSDCTVQGIRRTIIGSKKFVVGKELLPDYNNKDIDEVLDTVFDGDFRADEVVTMENNNKHISRWLKFAKLPYRHCFIENSVGGYLLEQKVNGFTYLYIDKNGSIEDHRVSIEFDGDTIHFVLKLNAEVSEIVDKNVAMSNGMIEHPLEAMRDRMKIWGFILLNALTYINTKNVSIETYKMTKSEAKRNKLPNVMIKQYDYHVVNIFHKKVVYEKLADVEAFSDSETTSHIRAHMVRGHFKQRKSGLYWWNPFLRCKKNQGFVDKDYIVH